MKKLADDVPDQRKELVTRPLVPPTYDQWTQTTVPKTMSVQGIHKKFLDALGGQNLTVASVKQALEPHAASMKPGHAYEHLVDLACKRHFKADGSGLRFLGTVNHPKIEAASGMRAKEHQQGNVMRESASEVYLPSMSGAASF